MSLKVGVVKKLLHGLCKGEAGVSQFMLMVEHGCSDEGCMSIARKSKLGFWAGVAALIFLAISMANFQGMAQPANNNFSNRIELVGYALTATGSNVGATKESGEPNPAGRNTTNTVWWKWVAPTSGVARVDTVGSMFDTLLSVYTGGYYSGTTLSNLSQVSYIQNNGNDLPSNPWKTNSMVTFNAVQGTEYQIQVGGRYSQTGPIELHVFMMPNVVLTSPTNNATYIAPATFDLVAVPQIFTTSVSRIEFYNGSTKLGEVTNSPYTFRVSNLSTGAYSFTARIYDKAYPTNTATSAQVNVNVIKPGAYITAPTSGQIFTGVPAITNSAYAEGMYAITNLAFLADGNVFANRAASNATVLWTNFTPGWHILTVVATDLMGNNYTSAPVQIQIKPFEILIPAGAVWKYLDDGTDQGTAWRGLDFDDAKWSAGPAQLGFGDGDEATVVTSNAVNTTYYFRRTFVFNSTAAVSNLICWLRRDDGAVIYLNGQELYRDNMGTGEITFSTLAAANASDDGQNFTPTNRPANLLRLGTNVIAVEIHQTSTTSSDISFDFMMVAEFSNSSPAVILSSPVNNAGYLQNSHLTLTAAAMDADGVVTAVEFYLGTNKLGNGALNGEFYTLTTTNLGVGNYSFSAVAIDNLGGRATSAVANVNVYPSASRWVAFNDYGPGAGTSPNATIYDPFGVIAPASGPLKDVRSGVNLSATMSWAYSAATGLGSQGNPLPGTPLDTVFGGYVDFAGTNTYNGIEVVGTNQWVTNTFRGLDPNRLYSFKGSAVRGNAAYTNRWTLVRIVGARSYDSAHTSNVLTQAKVASLGPDEAALQTGVNTSGDYVGWDNIVPAADGSFSVICSQYVGPVPGGSSDGPRAYALTGIRLEEFAGVPQVTLTSPANGASFNAPTNITLSATASSISTVTNVSFFANGNLVFADLEAPYTYVWTNAPWTNLAIIAVAYDSGGGVATSAVANITVIAPPPNLDAPYIVSVTPAPGAVTNLTNVVVRFNENVTGVDASDLLFNGVPATNVTGSGSNYTFRLAQPPIGQVLVTWAINHGIMDTGYPPRAFDHTATNATWVYNVVDGVPPTIVGQVPPAGATISNLYQIIVTFSEPVTNVDAGDLLVNGTPAYSVTRDTSNYIFQVNTPSTGLVQVAWASGHGITDLSGNPFNGTGTGATWTYTFVLPRITLVASNAYWYWRLGTSEASNPTNAWRTLEFVPTNWNYSQGPFYYDTDGTPVPYTGNTLISGMQNVCVSAYFRHVFVVTNRDALTNLLLRYRVDDGMAVWLNNIDIYRIRVPSGELPYTTTGNNVSEPLSDVYVSITNADALVEGTNVLAIFGANANLTSSDFLLNVELTADYLDPSGRAPRVVSVTPPAGTVNALTNITVTFSKPVTNVDAGDLLINGQPASAMSGRDDTYTFSFSQPAYGMVNITWAANHGITDFLGLPFVTNTAGANWSYSLINPNAPYIVWRQPAPNDVVITLTNITVNFNKPVVGVDAADLLVNGTPATALSGAGSSYTFQFPQPAYGVVTVTWAENHGIASAENPSDEFNARSSNATWQINLVFQEPPVVARVEPAPGRITNLTSITVTFSENVSGVDAGDLLINGFSALGMTGSGSNYTFTFAQPPVGPVQITWANNHNITDNGYPALPFDHLAPGATWSYLVVDGTPPFVVSQNPPAGSSVAGLIQIEVTFSESVSNLDAGDLLINGVPATGVSGVNGHYTFTFPAVAPGIAQVSWASGHGITDLAGNPFDGNGAGARWSYEVYNPNAPVITARLPLPGATTNVLTNILVVFSKPVTNVDAADLLINGLPATGLAGGPSNFVFSFSQPAYGQINVTWASNHGIVDLSVPPNAFEAWRQQASWSFSLVYQAPPVLVSVTPARNSYVSSLTSAQVVFSEAVTNVDAADLLVNGVPATGLSGSGSNYVFTFPQPPLGTVTFSWAAQHGITDIGIPPMPFDANAPEASWSCQLVDTNPPVVVSQSPLAGATISSLNTIQVLFSKTVTNVDAGDLLINGVSAISLIGGGSNYTFGFAQPAYGTVSISWAQNHGITDLAGNPFNRIGAGATWSYQLVIPRTNLVASNAVYRWRLGTSEASTPIDAWRQPGFDVLTWSQGQAPFYYDDDRTPVPFYGNTLITGMRYNYSSVYLRHEFVVTDRSLFTNLVLRSAVDDGMVVWLNNVEIYRINVPSSLINPAYNSYASPTATEPVTNDYRSVSNILVNGTNVLAVMGFNSSLSSSDLLIDLDLTADYLDPNAQGPRVVTVTPPPGTLYSLTNLTVIFSQTVTNVDAADLLINGIPATNLTANGVTNVFRFAQPAWGVVNITWATNHGIVDLAVPPRAFNAASERYQYYLVNPDAPIIASRQPPQDGIVGVLTQAVVNFSRPVTNVNASDFLINGTSATSVSGSNGTYTFTFPQPAYGVVRFSWAASTAIRDLSEPPNFFDANGAGASWQVVLVDMQPPVIASVSPPPGSSVSNLTSVLVTFSEPVSGVDARDLLVNGVAANVVYGSGAVYEFHFIQPNASTIVFTWSPLHGIADLAASPNAFDPSMPGNTWSYQAVDNIAPAILRIYPPMGATVAHLFQVEVTFTEPVAGLEAGDLLINNAPATGLSGAGAGPYIFQFVQPPTGMVQVAWAAGHGITDLATPPNSFAGGSWSYVLDPNASGADQIVISEIMYHPASENTNHEWIELHNRGNSTVNVTAWRFTRGIDFTFPEASIPPGGYLVVAANRAAFSAVYPSVTNVVGDWVGQLSNGDEEIRLETADGKLVNSVHYADEGEWSLRQRSAVMSGLRGWEWYSPHDGSAVNTATGITESNRTLELRNPLLPNQYGQNWGASTVSGGTPGRANTLASTNIAPMIVDATHFPLVPTSSDPVTISARIIDELTTGLSAILYYRDHTGTNPPAFSTLPMYDDGQHNDGRAGDGVYAATLPAFPNGTVIEFYIEAGDLQNNRRTWPAPARLETGVMTNAANALYQVSDEVYQGTQMPFYRLILTGTERYIFQGPDPLTFYQTYRNSDAEMNATFIASYAGGLEKRYLCGVRIRGAGSRSRAVPNFRLNIPSDRRWNNVNEINLNTQFIHSQLVGNSLAIKSGIPCASERVVQVRLNGVNLVRSAPPVTGSSTGHGFGSYVHLEVYNKDWANRVLPQNSGGNLYRASTGAHNADLSNRGANTYTYYLNHGYTKTSNQSENDWSDMDSLTAALSTGLPDSQYFEAVSANADVHEWMRYFALAVLLDYSETSIMNGRGDDYAMYRGTTDRRFYLLPHDFDTILGQGDATTSTTGIGANTFNTNESIWMMINPPNTAANVPTLNRFMTNNVFAPIYFEELKRLCDTTFMPEQVNPLFDQLLSGWVPEQIITSMKNYAAARRASVLSQLPLVYAVNVGLTQSNGYYRTTSSSVTLNGQANAIETRAVRVNNSPATWVAWVGRWTNTISLQPGINNVLVQFFGSNNVEVARSNIVVWYDTQNAVTVSGAITTDTTWAPATGPYRLTGSITVGDGVTLTIQAGTTVYWDSGVTLTVSGTGRVLAEGTEYQRIRFTRAPGVTGTWGRIYLNGASRESRFVNVDFEYGGSSGQVIRADNALLYLENCSFGNITAQYLTFNNSSFIVRGCVFPSLTGRELVHGVGVPANGYAIFDGNWFGGTTGLNDIIDFTGGQRPNAILQILNNVFSSASDDVLDLDGTDAHIEGNIFMNVRHDSGTSQADTSSAISGGRDGTNNSRLMIVRNLFFNCEHVALAKEGNYYWVINNTIVGCSHAAFNFDEPGRRAEGVTPGLGMYLDGNIIWNTATNFENVYVNDPTFGTTQLEVNRCILSGPDFVTNGVGNINSDPQFANLSGAGAWQTLTNDLRLKASSPARGAGPNGLDMGALVQPWASIAGEPISSTPNTMVTLTVGGPGITAYRYNINGGPFFTNVIPVGTPLVLSNLSPGLYQVQVLGQNSAGVWQSSDRPTTSRTWLVVPGAPAVRLNELLAFNRNAVFNYGKYPDVVELYNDSDEAVDVSGMRLTDNPAQIDKFIFDDGTTIPPKGYLVVFGGDEPYPGIYMGFNLNKDGGSLALYDRAERGSTLLDSVSYGPQIADLSIGRLAGGEWGLTIPTIGAANVRAPCGSPDGLKINEWMTSGETWYVSDFIEIYNPASVPVNMGGLYLTDNPVGWPFRNRIPPLTFIAANGYQVFLADGKPENGPMHLNFKLAGELGMIGLLEESGRMIDSVLYQPQITDYSQGRSPNGGTDIIFFSQPTPGAGNPPRYTVPTTNIYTTNIYTTNIYSTNIWVATNVIGSNVISLGLDAAYWRYNDTGSDLNIAWRQTTYSDASWPQGLPLFNFGGGTFAVPINTTLSAAGLTVYFRNTFNPGTIATGSNIVNYLQISHIVDDGAVYYLNGQEIYRYNMPAGDVNYLTPAASTISGSATLIGPVLVPAGIVPGSNLIAVEVHNASQSSSDLTFWTSVNLVQYTTQGYFSNAVITNISVNTITVTNITGLGVVINEIMANSRSFTNVGGDTVDWVELFNLGNEPVNLAGYGLTDDSLNPYRFVFPSNSTIAAHGYLVVICDGTRPASTNWEPLLNSGFGLKASGGSVFLVDSTNNTGGVLDGLSYGIQAGDFTVGRSPDGTVNWVLTLPTPGAVNLAAQTGSPYSLRINEWMPNDSGGKDDWFELYNPLPQPVPLGGLHLTDDLNNRTKFRIAPLSFIGASTNGFVKFVADNNVSAGNNHVNFKLDNTSEAIGLSTGNGTLIDFITYQNPQNGVSEGRFPDGSDNIVRFPGTESPAASNYRKLTNVVINEVLTHTAPPFEDAIELHNVTDQPVDISGWFLSDASSTLTKFRIPDGTIIPAGGYVVFYEYQFNSNAMDNPFAFALNSSKGDEVYLSTATPDGILTGYRASASFGAALPGVSFGRYVNSVGKEDYVAMSARTFGVDDPNTVEEFRQGQGAPNAYPLVGPVVIRQIMYHPPDIGTNDNVLDEFIELYNTADYSVPLYDPAYPTNTWRLRDAVDYEFPTGTILEPGGSLIVVSFDPVVDTNALAAFREHYGVTNGLVIYGPYRGKLDNGSDNVELYQPDAPRMPPDPDAGHVPYVLVERVKYADIDPWPTAADGMGASLQRVSLSGYADDPTNWVAAAPVFGVTNSNPVLLPPTLAPVSNRVVNEGETLSITNSAYDPNRPPVTLEFSLGTGAPQGATINPSTGVFQWTPGETYGGTTNSITIIVTQAGEPHLSATQTFQVVVLEANSPPVIGPLPDIVAHPGDVISFFIPATDSDIPVNALYYMMLSGAPSGAALNFMTGSFRWTPTINDLGTYQITVAVYDDGSPSLVDVKTFTIKVVPRTAVVYNSGGATLTWDSSPGRTYRVQYSTNLVSGPWFDLGDVTATSSTSSKQDPAARTIPFRFYRILLLP